jgi:opacity protein-like surface antigen
MKKTITYLIAILISASLGAQGLYVKLNVGYGMPASSQNIEGFNNYTSSYSGGDYWDETVERVNFSLGQGINIGGNIGYMFNSNFGLDLGLSYLMGGKTEASGSELYDSWYYYTSETKRSVSSTMFRFSPSFILVADMLKINPYARFGVVVGKGKINIEMTEDYYEDYDGIYEYTEKRKLELSEGMSVGLSAGIGALYNVAGNISVFGELSMISMTYAPEKGKLVEFTRNGEDYLMELSRYEKEIIFLDKIDGYDSEPQGDEPQKQLKTNMPFGSFGLNLGIRIGF